MPVYRPTRLTVYLPVCRPGCLLARSLAFLPVCLSTGLPVRPVHLSVWLPIDLPAGRLSVCQVAIGNICHLWTVCRSCMSSVSMSSVYMLSVCLLICLPICQSGCRSVSPTYLLVCLAACRPACRSSICMSGRHR